MSPDLTGVVLQYGFIGVVSLVLAGVVRMLFNINKASADASVTAANARADRYEAEVRQLNADLREKLVPVLVQATQVLGEVLVELREDRRAGP